MAFQPLTSALISRKIAASVGTTIGELHETVNGYAAPRDVETMLQLVHLYFTAPRRDTASACSEDDWDRRIPPR